MNTPVRFTKSDTAPAVEAQYYALLRSLREADRLAIAARLSSAVRTLVESGIRERHPDLDERGMRWHICAICYGEALARRAYGERPGAGQALRNVDILDVAG